MPSGSCAAASSIPTQVRREGKGDTSKIKKAAAARSQGQGEEPVRKAGGGRQGQGQDRS